MWEDLLFGPDLAGGGVRVCSRPTGRSELQIISSGVNQPF